MGGGGVGGWGRVGGGEWRIILFVIIPAATHKECLCSLEKQRNLEKKKWK